MRDEGPRGFYKGLSASYLGVTEGTIQWVLYERLKKLSKQLEGRGAGLEWLGLLGSAGTAKCVATLITYPHEVCLAVDYMCGSLTILLIAGHSDTTTAATRERQNEIHWLGPNVAHRHCGRRHRIPLWRS
jgi:hypothetical protein